MSSSRSTPPCAVCKTCDCVCNEECVLAPYFSPDQSLQFQSLDRVYGDINAATILNELRADLREYAVSSLVYESHAQIKDPIYGCVTIMYRLQQRINQLESELHTLKQELATYKARQGPVNSQKSYEVKVGIELDLLRNLEQYQQQVQETQHRRLRMKVNSGFDGQEITPTGFTHFAASPEAMSTTSLTLGGSFTSQIAQQHQQQKQQQQQQHQKQGIMLNIGLDDKKSTPTGFIKLALGDSVTSMPSFYAANRTTSNQYPTAEGAAITAAATTTK